MLAEECLVLFDQAEGVLLLRAAGQDVTFRREGQPQGIGSEAARPPERHDRLAQHPNHGIIVARIDIAIVEQELVRDLCQSLDRLAIADGDRLFAQVAARHHERPVEASQQQMVERRVRKHQPQSVEPWRDVGGDLCVRPPPHQDDRSFAALQRVELDLGRRAQPLSPLQVGDHQRERLAVSALARTQPRHRLRARGVARQLKATQPLDGDDLSLAQQLRALLDRVRAPRLHLAVAQPHLGTTRRTGHRLRVEAPVAWVLVLAPAIVAHGETAHRRAPAVVGQRLDDREAGSAVRAVGERVAIAAVGGIEQLAQTRVAGGRIGRDGLPAFVQLARDDLEGGETAGLLLLDLHLVDPRQGRRPLPQIAQEAVQRLFGAVQLDLDLAVRVPDPARQPVALGQLEHERPEADALNGAAHLDAKTPQAPHSYDRPRPAHSTRPSTSPYPHR